MLMSLPLLSLGFMLGSRAARSASGASGAVPSSLRAERCAPQHACLSLCALYALCTALIMSLSEWIRRRRLRQAAGADGQGRRSPRGLEALLADPRLSPDLVARSARRTCLSVPPSGTHRRWVYWQGQSVGQALFSGALAMWRCEGAFLMYALASSR